MKTIREIDVFDKRILVRCDFNVSLDNKGNILESFRIKDTIPTINYLLKNKAKIILMSHLDDPGGMVIEKLRLTKIGEKLKNYLSAFSSGRPIPIIKADDCVGEIVKSLSQKLKPREILLLENLRFHPEEEENNDVFARELAKLGDLYVNDAFGVCHRSHASVVGVPKYLPKAIGFLLEKELKILTELMENPQKPLIAIIGGKKIETKIKLINRIAARADFLLINGLVKKELQEKNIKLEYPQKIVAPLDSCAANLDIGPQTIRLFREKILQAKTVFWNGPLGKFEEEEFSKGTKSIAEAIIESKAFSIVGGGETVEAINKFGLGDQFNHLSTGGGAMLAFLAGEMLPGLEALRE